MASTTEKSKYQIFRDLKFGMFIHFGLYSLGEDHEWHLYRKRMKLSKYKEKYLYNFNPSPQGMEQWVKTAKDMGAKYIVCTSKHHDGFCLWDTKIKHPVHPKYHIRNTKFWEKNNTDILTLLFEAGRKHGIRIGLYYSTIDFSFTKQKFFGMRPKIPKDPQLLMKYNDYYLAQLHELQEIFADNLLFWFDGYQFKSSFPQLIRQNEVYNDLTSKYSQLLVAGNTGKPNSKKETGNTDILLKENAATSNNIDIVHSGVSNADKDKDLGPGNLPGEFCLTLNNHWGYNSKDKNYKPVEDLVKTIKMNDTYDTNTLLNFGPHWNGFIIDEQVEIAKKIGEKLKKL